MEKGQFAKKEFDDARALLYPVKFFESTLKNEIADADKIYYKFIREQPATVATAANAATAPQQPQGDTKPDSLKGIVFKRDKQLQNANAAIEQANEQQRIANAAIEQARIAEDARIEAVKAREVEKMKAEENKKNEKWWKGNSVSDSEFSLRFPGGGRRGKKKSKKMKNAKNKSKSKSKSQSRRQRQKRRRHSRRV